MVVASRPSQPKRTYQRRNSGSYSTVWMYSAAATGPSRWAATSSCARSLSGRARSAAGYVQPGQLPFAVGAAGPAHDEQGRVGITELRQCAHGEVGSLERLDATDEQEE